MAVFQVFDPQVEVYGSSFRAMTEAIKTWPATCELARIIFKAYGIEEIEPDLWYPQQMVLNVFRDISVKMGGGILHMIGKQVPDNALFPPDVNSIETALRAINIAYHMNHRGGEIGSYELANVQPNQIQMICHNPYPCDFDHGLVEAMARRFAPPQTLVTVRHHPLRPCRKLGDTTCMYLVSWKKQRLQQSP